MRKSRKILQIIIFPLILLIVLGYILSKSEADVKEENYIKLDKGWDVTLNQNTYNNAALSELKFPLAGRGDVVVMEQSLPNTAMENPVLKIYNIHSDMQVELEGEEIYSYGQEEYDAGEVVGYGYHFVTLPDDYMGKSIKITMRVSENDAFASLEIPFICNENYMMRDFVIQNRLAIYIDIFLMMFGVCLAVICGAFIIRQRGMKKLIFIALFSFFIGMWSFCSYDVITIFTYDLSKKVNYEFASLYLAPMFLFAYFWTDIEERGWRIRKAIYYIILFIQLLFISVTFVMHLFNIMHMCEVLRISHLLDAAMAFYLVYMFIHDIKRHKLKNPVLFFGIIVMVILLLSDIVRFNIQKYTDVMTSSHFSSSLYVGALIFVLSLFVDFCVGIARNLYDTAASEALEKMAYTDELTGLANRRRCEEFFDELDESDSDYIIVGFDLNNLKVVNDTLGHDEGDRFIKEFAEILNSVFGKQGLVGRIGGDEFIVMIKDAAKIEVKTLIDKMNQQIDKKNQEKHQWNMSVAYGICAASEGGVKTSRYAYKVADERMYRKKFEMKECVSHE